MIESFIGFASLVISFVCLGIAYWYLSRPKNIPGGPIGLPFLGTALSRERPHKELTELAEKYGSMFSYYSFGQLVVVLNKYDLIRDLIIKQGDKFADRPQTDLIAREQNGNHGLVFANGHLWKEQRRFALSTLRDFGFGKPILENGILEEVDMLVSAIRQESSQPFDIQSLLNKAVSNVICQLVYGKRFEYSNEYVFHVLDAWNRKLKGTNVTTGLGLKLWMVPFLPGLSKRLEDGAAETATTRQFTTKMIEEHRKEFDPANEPTDYTFAYMNKQKQLNGEKGSFSDEQLLIACNQLFAAGTETTATTLRWAILYCTVYPEVQEKVFQEIRDTIGLECLPRLKDRNQLPYTEAAMLESQRCGCLVAITVRQTTQDVQVNGYSIPANTPVVLNYWGVHMDPQLFPQPEKFMPERFLDESGKLRKDDGLVPFGAGKRICLGESLAKMELSLFFVALIQNFKFVIPKGEPRPSLEHIAGITMQPQPFRVEAIPRLAAPA